MRKGIATTAILIALAVAIGILLAAVPNVEGISVVSFFSGYLTGWRSGGVIGGTAMLLLSLLNPLGPAPPPVFAAQVLGMALMGASGRLLGGPGGRVRLELRAMLLGAMLTLVYDGLTNFGVAVSIGKARAPLVVMLAGAPFSAIHIVSNILIFGATAAVVARRRGFGAHDERRSASNGRSR
jgi:hypothetical protein